MAEADISIEKLYDKVGSIYKMVTLASKRALELNAGAPRLIEDESDNIYLIALREIAEGKISCKQNLDKS